MESLMALVMGIASSIWRGFIVSVLWTWFMVPLFGMPHLAVPMAMGLLLITHLLSPWVIPNLSDTPQPKKKLSPVLLQIVYQLVYLLFLFEGWVIHRFFM